jgi:hypothetical protein
MNICSCLKTFLRLYQCFSKLSKFKKLKIIICKTPNSWMRTMSTNQVSRRCRSYSSKHFSTICDRCEHTRFWNFYQVMDSCNTLLCFRNTMSRWKSGLLLHYAYSLYSELKFFQSQLLVSPSFPLCFWMNGSSTFKSSCTCLHLRYSVQNHAKESMSSNNL